MKISELIKTLKTCQKLYGDVPVKIMDKETGKWRSLVAVSRLHPYTGEFGSLNRQAPVDGIALWDYWIGPSDLTIFEKKP